MRITSAVATAAGVTMVALVWWNQRVKRLRALEAEGGNQCLQEALDTFEGEGGLVLS